ncbi:protein toll-like [Mytilus californianus]|uniref:protein toll-like n=1 Tax=Mytilus californianus TaxID=6549 RepID=UPI002246D121|nr:protein toll-like [Mytilus californianus]
MDNMIKVICILMSVVSEVESNVQCNTELKPFMYPPLFSLNSQNIESIGRQIHILTPTNCSVNVTNIITHFDFPTNNKRIGLFGFVCHHHIKVSFGDLHRTMLQSNVIGYVQLMKCQFDVEEMDLFLSITNSRVFTINIGNFYSPEHQTKTTSCKGFKRIVSVSLVSIHNDIMSSIENLFNCNDDNFQVKEILIGQCTGQINQTIIRQKFPRLQTLSLVDCNISGTLEFPWAQDVSLLPDNLSRSDYMQDHYSKSLHLSIPPNIFRRQLTLTNNEITGQQQVKIYGLLHFVKISNNNISEIDENLFMNVLGLQVIIITNVGLRFIGKSTFSGQNQLTYLDLSNNEINDLPSTVFNQLPSLKYICLSHNNLQYLREKLFSDLEQLMEINLENNMITAITDGVLPVNSITLKTLILSHNPLVEFPVCILYIRSLRKVELKSTYISFRNMTAILEKVDTSSLLRSVNPSSSSIESNFLRTTDEWRIVDLTGSRVTGFFIDDDMCCHARRVMLVMLKHFKFEIKENHLTCFSNIIPFNKLMQNFTESGHWTGDEYFFTDWFCEYPREFERKSVLSIKAEDTYSQVNISECPTLCKCYFREVYNVTIVNCRGVGLSKLPHTMSSSDLDLWLENNNISKLIFRSYLSNVRQLILSHNRIENIDPTIFRKLENLKILKLDNNLLTHIPKSIDVLQLNKLCLKNNPFVCDCRTLWFKKWLLRNILLIDNLREVTCNSESKNGHQIIHVPDYKFTCKNPTVFHNYAKPVAAATSVILIISVIAFSLVYYRFEIKVLLYVSFEWHPFDRGKLDRNEIVDLTIIHAIDTTEFVDEQLVLPLQQLGFVICSQANDFIAGYSVHENISSAVFYSKHVLLILSENMISDSVLLDFTLAECQDKMKVNRANFLLVTNIARTCRVAKLNKELQKYIKLHQHLRCQESLFLSKIRYILTSYKTSANQDMMADLNHRRLLPIDETLHYTKNHEYDLFFCYSSDERDFCQNNLIPRLEKESYRICTPDSHFHPGVCILTNIGLAVESSSHTIFVTSNHDSFDELQLFVFQRAIEKTRFQKYNHLIVILIQGNTNQPREKDMIEYFHSFVYLEVKDKQFFSRLKTAILQPNRIDISDVKVRNAIEITSI